MTGPHDNFRLRGAGLQEIHSTAIQARSRFKDLVSDSVIYTDNGNLHVGVNEIDPAFHFSKPTRRAHNQLASRADIPQKHYDRLFNGHTDLWAQEMIRFQPKGAALYRFIDGDTPGFEPTLRAVLSDRYSVIDNVDTLTALLTALHDAGLGPSECQVTGDFDAEDGRMCIRVTVPSISAVALDLVRNYNHGGRRGVDYPLVFAGLEMTNHETGGGAWSIRDRVVLQVCTNGMTRDIADFRKVHLGGKLEQGIISWSDTTREKQLAFVASAATDAIRTLISPEHVRAVVEEATAAKENRVVNVEKAMSQVVKTCQLTDDEANKAMLLFIEGGDTSVLGLANAVTALAQEVPSGERQSELEASFWSIVGRAEQLTGA